MKKTETIQDNKELFTGGEWAVIKDKPTQVRINSFVRLEQTLELENCLSGAAYNKFTEGGIAEANAALIAQAPAMYKALEKNHELLLRYYTSNTAKLHEEDLKDLRTAMAEIQSILNKANPKQ